MSIIDVYRSVPGAQYRHHHTQAPALNFSSLRNSSQSRVDDSTMSLSSGAPIFAPSTATEGQGNVAPNSDQTVAAGTSTSPPKVTGNGTLPSIFPESNDAKERRPASQDENGGVRSLQNRPSQTWAAPQSPRISGVAGNHQEVAKEEDLMGDNGEISNGEEGDNGQPGSNGDREENGNGKRNKRFRLTHNQTRFLMSEFTRQAHPDAAHRERLSREIPGLSPRQVQVWFQNRRAKLKRLTSQDRDRVLKSRALPDHFDRSQMLQEAYNSRQTTATSPTSPTTARSSFASTGHQPLAISSIKRIPGDEYPISPGSVTPAFNNYGHSPGLSDSFSPTSTAGHPTTMSRTAGMNNTAHHQEYSRSQSFSGTYAPSWQHFPQRFQIPPLDSGLKSESNLNPLHRPTASYSGMTAETAYDRHGSQASSVDHTATTQTINGALPQAMAYSAPQSSQQPNEPYPPTSHVESAYQTPVNYRHVLSLQTGQLPPPPEYQVSPFTTSYNFDPFYQQYTPDHSSAVSLPGLYIRSTQQGAYEPSNGTYSYENHDMSHRLSAPQPGDTR